MSDPLRNQTVAESTTETPLGVPKGRCEMDHSPTPRLLDRVRGCIRLKHYSLRTEQA
jgi:hypothetical protein